MCSLIYTNTLITFQVFIQPFSTVIYMYSVIQCTKELKNIKVKE